MIRDLLLFTDENLDAQLETAPFDLGTYQVRFYVDGEKPVNRGTGRIGLFHLSPSGGTLRDASFTIVFYDSRFDTYRGFVPPHLRRTGDATRVEHAVKKGVTLAPLTTIGMGGPAAFYISCTTMDAIRDGLDFATTRGLPLHVLGGGSNTLFDDAGFSGVVLHPDLRGITVQPLPDRVLVTARAGEDWDPLVAHCTEHGLAGIECLSGIPGTVGATPIQNVGAYGQDVSQVIARVSVLDLETGAVVHLTPAECEFRYRDSMLKTARGKRYIVVEVQFLLRPDGTPQVRYQELQRALDARGAMPAAGPAALQHVRDTVLALRAGKSMVLNPTDPDTRSLGSFFMNPVLPHEEFTRLSEKWPPDLRAGVPRFDSASGTKIPAAWLVEHAGFPKGYRRGNVGISAHHALALVNYGGSCRELLALATDIQSRVHEIFGIALQREPVVVPRFPAGAPGLP